jgi:uncharacterized protein (DUF302 family)
MLGQFTGIEGKPVMKKLRLLKSSALAATVIAVNAIIPATAENSTIKSYSFQASYEDAVFDLGEALTNKGLVIDHKARVANMLNRTAKDIGATKTVYKNGVVIEFCSAKLSRAAMEADPLNMAFCPYSMFVFETTARPGTITVGYKVLSGASNEASQKVLAAVNKLMDEMVREAVGLDQ